jgi:hypothetical protein
MLTAVHIMITVFWYVILSNLFRQLPMFLPRTQKKHVLPESLNVSFKLHSCISQKAVILKKTYYLYSVYINTTPYCMNILHKDHIDVRIFS